MYDKIKQAVFNDEYCKSKESRYLIITSKGVSEPRTLEECDCSVGIELHKGRKYRMYSNHFQDDVVYITISSFVQLVISKEVFNKYFVYISNVVRFDDYSLRIKTAEPFFQAVTDNLANKGYSKRQITTIINGLKNLNWYCQMTDMSDLRYTLRYNREVFYKLRNFGTKSLDILKREFLDDSFNNLNASMPCTDV